MATRNPNLIPCYKKGNPDEVLWADEKQLKKKAGKLIRLKGEPAMADPAPAPKAKGKGKPAPTGDTGKGEGEPEKGEPAPADDPEERKALMAEAEAHGVQTHPRMKNATIKEKVDAAKAAKS